jgi:hypothetical protein
MTCRRGSEFYRTDRFQFARVAESIAINAASLWRFSAKLVLHGFSGIDVGFSGQENKTGWSIPRPAR